ncbi:MAG: type IV secretory system conjugative DNA transfer family protein [Geminicoccaceae bacterium]
MSLGGYLWKTAAAWFLSGAVPKGGEEGTARIGKFQNTWPLDHDQDAGDWFLGRVVPRDSIASLFHQKMIAHKAKAKQHLWILKPTRGGKGIYQIMPNILMHPGSTILIDPKGEGYDVAAEALKAKGYNVVLLDPLRRCALRRGVDRTGDECEFNPLFEINPYDVQASRQLEELAEILIEAPPGAQHAGAQYWTDQARIVCAGLLGFSLIYRSKEAAAILKRAAGEARARLGRKQIGPRDLQLTVSDRRNVLAHHNIVSFCADFASKDADNLALIVQEMAEFKECFAASGDPLPEITDTIVAGGRQAQTLLGKGSYAEGRATLMSMFAKSFKWVRGKTLKRDLTGLDFKFRMSDVRTKERTAIFLVLPESALTSHGAWLRMVITSAINTISEVDWAPGINDAGRWPAHSDQHDSRRGAAIWRNPGA